MSRLRSFADSLKFRLTLGAVASLTLGMGFVALLLMRQAEHDTLASQRQRQVTETARIGQILARRVVDLQRALQVTAAQLDPPTLADRERLAEFIRAKPVLNAMFSSVYVVSTEGRMLVLEQGHMQSLPDTLLTDRPYLQRTLAEGRPVVSDPVISRVSGAPMLAFTYPLIRDGTVFGVLAGSLGLASRELVADLVDDDESGSLMLVADATGRVLAHPDPTEVLGMVARQPRLNEAFKAWVASGSPAEPSGLSLPQTDELVSISGVAGTDWVVWRAVPKQELLAPLRAAREHALKLVGLLLLAMSAVMFALMAWLLRPLALLSMRAQHLFDGQQPPQEGWPSARGELGQLTQVLRDVGAERAQLEAFNAQVLKQLGSVMSAAPIGIAFTREQRFELVNAELCRMLGRSQEELIGRAVETIYADRAHYLRTLEQMEPAFRDGLPYQGEWQMIRADGVGFCAQLRGRPVDSAMRGSGTIWTVSDVTAQVASRERLEWSATHDALTGLANRKLLEQRLAEVFVNREAAIPSAVMAIDLDHFKPVNDAAGHAAGDAMLKAVAAAIGSRVRTSDLVARTGGDEFAVVLEGCPSATAMRIADEIRLAIIGIALPWDGAVLRVGASLGIAQLGSDTADVQAWLGEADAACYQVKREGRGAVRANTSLRLALVP
jgi:diguanylate cyclase (GGDEF)-like protein/PAS domain S-box-containing protein